MAWRPTIPARPLARLKSQPSWICGSPRLFVQSHGFHERQGRKSSFTPSDEQMRVAMLCRSQNVVVSARPGSGKTATAEAIATAHPDKRIAVLTYSKGLQEETRKRLKPYENCNVLTFHAMAGKLFKTPVRDDTELREQRRKVLRSKNLPQWNFAPFDIIILDEFQDCTDILFWLTNSFILANDQKKPDEPARLVVLGDERQCIYQYRAADPRYLSLAPKLFKQVNPYPFAEVPLSESFRLSNETVQFINRVFLDGEPYITSSKTGRKPMLLRCSPFDSDNLAKNLADLIQSYGAENSAILAPSIRKNAPIQRLTNALSKHYKIPIAVQIHDDGPYERKVMAGKVCVSTIHQFKGSERDLVILFGMDASFFDFFGCSLPNDRCPNEVFVALTRAAKQLVLVHSDSNKLMPFVSVKELYKTADVISMTKGQNEITPPDKPGRPPKLGLFLPGLIRVCDMHRHLSDESLKEIIENNVSIRKLSPPLPKEEHIDVTHIVSSNRKRGLYERVDDLNGLAVVAAFEHNLTGSLRTFNLDKYMIQESPAILSQKYSSWLCRRACSYEADVSGYRSRYHQMKRHKFNWMNPEHLTEAKSRLQRELGDAAGNLQFEVGIDEKIPVGLQSVHVQGRADIVVYPSDPGCNEGNEIESVWEIKFVSQLSHGHAIQVCIYTYLLASQSDRVPRTILYNVRDGEKWEITPRNGREGLRRLIESTLRLKYTKAGQMGREKFIEMCTKTMREVRDVHSQQA